MKKSLIALGIGMILGVLLYLLLHGGLFSNSDAQRGNPVELREDEILAPKKSISAPVETRTHGSDEPRPVGK